MEFVDYYPGCILVIADLQCKGSVNMSDDGWWRFKTINKPLSPEQKSMIVDKLKELNKPLEEATQEILKNLTQGTNEIHIPTKDAH
jgi:hypothetical protein